MARECCSSLVMASSRTARNSLKVRWRVVRVRCGVEGPNKEVARRPRRVGWEVEGSSRIPKVERMLCMLSKKEERGGEGRCCSWESSRRAQSITIRMLFFRGC